MEMGVSGEDVELTNNNGRQNSNGNNGRRVWIPRGRGNPNPIPNPNSVAKPRSGGREKPISNPKPAKNSNLDCIGDTYPHTNPNPAFSSYIDSNSKSNANLHESSNHNLHGDTGFNWNASNGSPDIRNPVQGFGRHHLVGSQEVERTKKPSSLPAGKQIVGGNSVSSLSQHLQLAESSSVRSTEQSHMENQYHRSGRWQSRKHLDKNNLHRRIEASSDKQNGVEIAGITTIDRNANDHSDSYSEASNHGSNSINENLVASFNGKKHSQSRQHQRREIKHHSAGVSGKNAKWIERDNGPSTSRQDSTNKDMIDPPNEIKSSHLMRQQRGQMEDLDLWSTERNDNYCSGKENGASKSGKNSLSQDLMLTLNDMKHPLLSIDHKRSEMEDVGRMNRRSSQDWRYHAPSSVAYARPLLKQEGEEVIHLERPNLPNLVQEIEQKLHKSKVECMICYEMVGRSAAIWSCNSCYALFHLHCVRKWARAPTSTDLSAGQSQSSNWRCPGCQSVQYSRPEDLQYYCFCGKMQNPSKDFYLTPHSCGEPCGKSLDKGKEMSRCPHSCTLQCHPGPCPPCTAMAAPQPCPCGKKNHYKEMF